jgi:hypothetical protein
VVSIVPILGVAAAAGAARNRRVAWDLGLLSIVLLGTATMVSSMPPSVVGAVIPHYIVPAVRYGQFSPNLGTVIGLPPHVAGFLPLVLAVLSLVYLTARVEDDHPPEH